MRRAQPAANDEIVVAIIAANVIRLVRKRKTYVLCRLRIQASLGDFVGATTNQQQQE